MSIARYEISTYNRQQKKRQVVTEKAQTPQGGRRVQLGAWSVLLEVQLADGQKLRLEEEQFPMLVHLSWDDVRQVSMMRLEVMYAHPMLGSTITRGETLASIGVATDGSAYEAVCGVPASVSVNAASQEIAVTLRLPPPQVSVN